ncbi:MAG: hypothetical protein HRU09_02330 [Oligoflexales bacterium]|nr:hypothetical protein [Oligoflexales bacterium]
MKIRLRYWFEPSLWFFIVSLADPTLSSFYVGSFICFLGAVVRIWTVYVPLSEKVGIIGPQNFVRYPTQLSGLMILLGIGLAAGNVHSFVPALIFYFFCCKQLIQQGERYRSQQFMGGSKEKVALFFPQLIPFFPKGTQLPVHKPCRNLGISELISLLGLLFLLLVLVYLKMYYLDGSIFLSLILMLLALFLVSCFTIAWARR